ncbi:MAG TPA: hypothetical protein VK213_10930 [Bacteroidales bacterium]|nr:hypothetical protein [Bacteroidales bacterium]
MDEKEVYIKTAKAYNSLNLAEIEPLFSENIIYESQGTTINGKVAVAADLKAKFESLKQAGRRIYAELAILPPKNQIAAGPETTVNPCLILSQGVQVNRVAVIILSSNEGVIEKIDVRTSSPHWTQAQGSGIFPA